MNTREVAGCPGWAARLVARCLLALLALGLPAWGQPLLLVTPEEVARELAAPPLVLTPRAVPQLGAPTIKVLSPVLGAEPLANPLRIELAFSAAADAEIDTASFRALYGALRIELTDRIVGRVTVERTGLKVDNVIIPRGSHRLLLRIADTKARIGETELRFTVQ